MADNFHHHFIHQCFSHFYRGSLDYFADSLRGYEHQLVSTYDKAVEYLRTHNGTEGDMPNLPAIILNPQGEFNIAETGTAKAIHRFPNLSPKFIERMYDPIYMDEQVAIHPGFSRIKGEFELIFLLNSFYEYTDNRMFLLQLFGGEGRPIHPEYINTFITIPEELKTFTYDNEYTGENYMLDWAANGAFEYLIETTNQTEVVFPVTTRPWFKLTGLSDGSEKYGATDNISQWRLTAQVEFEVELPTFLLLKTDWMAENIQLNTNFGSFHSEFDFQNIDVNKEITFYNYDNVIDVVEGVHIVISPDESDIVESFSALLNNRYVHFITQPEIDDTIGDLEITMPEPVTDSRLVVMTCKLRKLQYGDDYYLTTDGKFIYVREAIYKSLDLDDILEIYTYERKL